MSPTRAASIAGGVSALIVALATIHVCGFSWSALDDHRLVLLQDTVTAPWHAGVLRLLATPGLGHPMPVTNATLAFDYATFGPNAPGAWHAHALVWLVATAGLLPWMVMAVGRAVGVRVGAFAAIGATVLVMSHPATAEVAGWIVARKDLCAGLFGVVAVGCLAESCAADEASRRGWFLAGVAALLCALGSKSSAVALPAVAVFAAAATRPADRTRWTLAGATLIVAGGVAALARRSQQALGLSLESDGAADWLAGVGGATVAQLRLLAFPQPRVPFPDPLGEAVIGTPAVLIGGATLLLASLATLAVAWRLRRGASAWTWVVVLLLASWLPVSGIPGRLQMGAAGRYLYLPLLLAAAPALGFAFARLQTRAGRRRTAVIVASAALATAGFWARDTALDAWRTEHAVGDRMFAHFAPDPGTSAYYWSCELVGMGHVLPHHHQVPGLDRPEVGAEHALNAAIETWKTCALIPPRDPAGAPHHARLGALIARGESLRADERAAERAAEPGAESDADPE